MLKRNNLNVIGLILVFLIVVAFQYTAPHVIKLALKANAENTGLSIAQLMGRRIPDLGLLNKDDVFFRDLDHSIKMKRVEHLAADVLAAERIHQIDFINSDCMCAISLGSYETKDNQKQAKVFHKSYGYKRAAFTGLKQRDFKAFKEDIGNHVFFDIKKHSPRTIGSHLKYQLPVNRELLSQLINGRQDVTFVKDTPLPYQPEAFGEVYHMVKVDGHVAYIIRIMVDLSAASSAYNDAANTIFWIGFGLLGFGFFYPVLCQTITQAEQATKKQETTKTPPIARFEIFTILALSSIVLILSFSNPLTNMGDMISIDKFKHVIAYAALGFVALYGRKTATSSFVAVIALLSFGIAIEFLQPLFGREADALDFVANVVGIAISCCALLIVRNFDSTQPAATSANIDP
ncbi:MAG: VanZ family protein [Hyphomicrobiales bacterium]